MKPIKLSMTAFGPYKGTEVIQFDELGEHRLFAISGKTGAGKTTIFDAICYALYGSGSGEDRQDTSSLRSGFAEDTTYTAVELVFEMHGRTYLILRQPGHIKSNNKTATGKKIELAELKASGPDYTIVEKQQTNEVDKKLQDIVGLTKDQFSQIVMLPQGEFRKLLTSDSVNKEAILRKIFKTDRFGEMTRKLDVKRKEAEKDLERAMQLRKHVMGQIDGALPHRPSALFECIANNTDNMYQLMAALEDEQTFYAQSIVAEQQRYDEVYALHHKEQQQFSAAKALNQQFEEQEKRIHQLQALQQQKAHFDAKKDEIVVAEKANALIIFEQQCKDLRAEQDVKDATFKKATQTKEQALVKEQQAQQQYIAEESKEQDRQDALQQELQFKSLLPTFEAFEQSRQQVIALEQQTSQLKKLLEGAQQQVERQKLAYDETAKKVEDSEKQLQPYESYLEKLPLIREQVTALQQYAQHEKVIQQQQFLLAEAIENNASAQRAFKQLEQSWLTNQVSIIAAKLVEGEPCPVCGSTTHNDVHTEQITIVDEQELEALKLKAHGTEQTYYRIEANLQHAKERLQEATVQLETLVITVEEQASLTASLHELEERVMTLKKVNEQLPPLRGKLKEQLQALENMKTQQNEHERNYQAMGSQLAQKQAVLVEQQNHIPENVQTLQALQQAIQDIVARKDALQKAWQNAQEQLQQAKEASSVAQSAWALTAEAFKEIEEKLNNKRDEFTESMKAAGFENYALYDASKRSASQITALREACQQYEQQLHAVKVQIEDGEKLLAGQVKQDLSEKEANLLTLKQTYEHAFEMLNRVKGYEEACAQYLVKINEASKEITELEIEAGRVN
ncbi:MAG: SMC family ATPase [Lysinibacillus sp.]